MPVPMHPRALHVADILLGAEKTGHDLAHWLDSAAGGANAWTEHLLYPGRTCTAPNFVREVAHSRFLVAT
jgi:hypothetical protein